MGVNTANNFFYKPSLGATGSLEKSLFDSGLDQVDARLGKEIWIGDMGFGNTFQEAISAIGSKQIALNIPSDTYTIGTNLTVSSNISLKFHRGAVLTINDGITLTLNCTVEAGSFQIFNCLGTGKVLFGPGVVASVLLRWWGAKGDNTTNDTASIRAAITCMNNSAGVGKGFTIQGTPGDIYLIDEITFTDAGSAPAYSGIAVLDGNGSTFRQRQVNGNLLTVTKPLRKLEIKNFSFIGAINHIWQYTGLVSEPLAVIYNGSAGGKKTSILACTAERDWYWDSGTSTLYVKVATSSTQTPNDVYTTILADSIPLTVTTRFYSGTGLNIGSSSGVGNMIVDNCNFELLNIGLNLHYCLLSNFTNLRFFNSNQAINEITDTGNCHMNTFNNIYAAAIYGTNAIYMENAYGNSIKSITTEYIKNRIASFSGMKSLHLSNWGMEAAGFGSCTENFLCDACEGVRIETSNLWLGGTNATAGLRFQNGTRGVTVENCQMSASIAYYDADSTCSGITFRNNQSWSSARFCANSSPVALVENHSPGTGAGYQSWFTLPANLVKVRTDKTGTEYSTVNPSFNVPFIYHTPVYEAYSNASGSIDPATGYDDNNSWKLSWTNTSAYGLLDYLFTQPVSGNYYGIISFYYKSDTAHTLQIDSAGLSAQGIPVSNDGIWRYCAIVGGSATTCNNSKPSFKATISSGSATGNLWIDCVSLRYFPTLAEAVAWAGCSENSPYRVINTLTVNSASPSLPMLAGSPAVFKTANTSSTLINSINNGIPGQDLTVILGDINTTIKAYGTYLTWIYNYTKQAGWSSNVYGGPHDYFNNTGAVDDCLYWGSQYYKFCGIRSKVGSMCDFTATFVWEYWNGKTWSNLAASDTTNYLVKNASGSYYSIYWPIPSDWVPTTVNGALGYWMRLRISTFTSGSEGGASATAADAPYWWRINGDLGPMPSKGSCYTLRLIYDGIWKEVARTALQ